MAWTFLLQPFDNASCSWQITRARLCLTVCSFKMEDEPKTVRKQSVHGMTYLFFLESTSLANSCSPEVSGGLTVWGRISVPLVLSVTAETISLLSLQSSSVLMEDWKILPASAPNPTHHNMSFQIEMLYNMTGSWGSENYIWSYFCINQGSSKGYRVGFDCVCCIAMFWLCLHLVTCLWHIEPVGTPVGQWEQKELRFSPDTCALW